MCQAQIPIEVVCHLAEEFNCPPEAIDSTCLFKDGTSGDQVYKINIGAPANINVMGEYVLKIRAGSTPDEFDTEINNANSAKKKCSSTTISIPSLVCFSGHLGYCVYDLAGTGMKETLSLYTQVPGGRQARLKELIRESLFAWKESYTGANASLTQMAETWLGEKKLALDSRLAQRIHTYIHDELSPAWEIDNLVLPNPYSYFICYKDSDQQMLLNNVLQGPQHGDLNQKNIIIQPNNPGYSYYFIDFSHYHSQSFLFFDQAYLLLDILLNTGNILLENWIEYVTDFLTALTNNKHLPHRDAFTQYCNAFIDGWLSFYTHYPQNSKALMSQLLCALSAAGLNFMSKAAASDNTQIFSFTFSSLAMHALLEHSFGICPNTNEEYPSFSFGTATGIPELWSIADGFSPANRYVLISPCLAENIDTDSFCDLETIPWTAVIEVNHLLENDLRNKALSQFRQKRGYRHILLAENSSFSDPCMEAAWCSVVMDQNAKNSRVFYARHIQPHLSASLKSIMERHEKYPLCIIVDSKHLDMTICSNILTDLAVAAGEGTMIDIINLSDCPISMEEDTYIRIHQIPCELKQFSSSVRITFKSRRNDGIYIPSQDGPVKLDAIAVTEIENDMRIIHHNLTESADDDQGSAFYLGGEATWHDISLQRDVVRIDYKDTWHDLINRRLNNLHSSFSSILWLYHKPGGGGTTMAKRIMWDFCTRYPTVQLLKISDRTAERLKTLYTCSLNLPLLIIAEINDSTISNYSLSVLRTDLTKRNVRALFICVSRINVRPKEEGPLNLYLPNTPQMYMPVAGDEAVGMLRSFSARLDPEQDHSRIEDLKDLTYSSTYSDELRQPFFYGLFSFGEKYQKLEEYVQINISSLDKKEHFMLSILAIITIYSQSINLNLIEITYILFPDNYHAREALDQTRAILAKNCFIVAREDGYRISHPLIAKKILEQMFGASSYTHELVRLAKELVECLGNLYSSPSQSPRYDSILHDLFIYREPITENQRTVFSAFIQDLADDVQRIDIMNYLRERLPTNPHYSNHLARLYLRPQDEDQWPDIPHAKQYAQEAIDRAERLPGDAGSIHHHLMGKVYTRDCISQLKQLLSRNHISYAIKTIDTIYQNAVREFNICSHGRNSAYGLIGKLELINRIFEVICDRLTTTIPRLLNKELSIQRSMMSMVAEAGNIIQQYIAEYDDTSEAFRSALLRFYKTMGNISDIEKTFNSSEPNLRVRTNSRRAMVTILESKAQREGAHFSYDLLSQTDLLKIKDLMEQNIYNDSASINSDRFRWLEAYRRLDSFDLQKAYRFLQEWPEGTENLDITYYRYVLSFLAYAKYQGVSYQTVHQHLLQCQQLAQKAYGKYITTSRNLLGRVDKNECDRASLVPWQYFELGLSQEERETRNRVLREEQCDFVTGSVNAIKDGIIDFRFSIEHTGHTLFYAKAPKVGSSSTLLDGQQVKFHLGFSYSGFRAWDIIPIA